MNLKDRIEYAMDSRYELGEDEFTYGVIDAVADWLEEEAKNPKQGKHGCTKILKYMAKSIREDR